MFNPVANLPPSTVALRSLLLSASLPSFFRFSVPFSPRLLPPAVLPVARSVAVGFGRSRSRSRRPPFLSGRLVPLLRMSNADIRFALVVALVFLVLPAVTFEEGVCCELRQTEINPSMYHVVQLSEMHYINFKYLNCNKGLGKTFDRQKI